MLIPLCRDKVASLDLVFSPNQLKSLNSRLRRSWPSSAARSVIKTITYSVFSRKQIDSCWSHLMKEDVYLFSAALMHKGCIWDFFSPRKYWDISQFYVPSSNKSEKNEATFTLSILELDMIIVVLFWFLARWYLNLRFVSNTFWTIIPKSIHSDCRHCKYVFTMKFFP